MADSIGCLNAPFGARCFLTHDKIQVFMTEDMLS